MLPSELSTQKVIVFEHKPVHTVASYNCVNQLTEFSHILLLTYMKAFSSKGITDAKQYCVER